jgi:hypothetical protein
MTSKTEFASTGHRGITSPFQGLARWAGVPLDTVAEYARDGRLAELVETRQYTRPLSGAEAMRRIEENRGGPGSAQPKSGARALGELRARRTIWEAEDAEAGRQGRPRDPYLRLAELRARQVPDWWSE